MKLFFKMLLCGVFFLPIANATSVENLGNQVKTSVENANSFTEEAKVLINDVWSSIIITGPCPYAGCESECDLTDKCDKYLLYLAEEVVRRSELEDIEILHNKPLTAGAVVRAIIRVLTPTPMGDATHDGKGNPNGLLNN